MHLAFLVSSLVGAFAVLLWRVRETSRPATARSILIPPLGMSTGFSMFIVPQMRIPPSWVLAAFAVGALALSYPLIRTSTMVRQGDTIMMKRSKAFLWILFVLVALRLLLRSYVERYVSTTQTAAIFFVLAFGMLLPWRVAMYLRYRSLRDGPPDPPASVPAL